MIWLVQGDSSHQIISCNLHVDEKTNMHQVWATRPNGKSFMIAESDKKEEVAEIKEAIDFAISQKDPVLKLA